MSGALRKVRRIALVGNPNCGKTTLFNDLTGTHQHVGNWPGVTVEKKTGRYVHADLEVQVVDLPGTYSLIAGSSDPVDQRIAQDFVLAGEVDLLVNVVDASCLERSLFLTSQLLDADVPVVIALNMVDVAHAHGVHLDPTALANRIGVPVVPIVASRGDGVGILEDVIHAALERQRAEREGETAAPEPVARLDDAGLAAALPGLRDVLATRGWLATERRIRALVRSPAAANGPGHAATTASAADAAARAAVETAVGPVGEALQARFVQARYAWVSRMQSGVVRDSGVRRTGTDRIDDVLLNRWLGIPIFLGVMYLMFLFSINVGSAFIDFFDISVGLLAVDAPRQALTALGAPAWLTALVADGLGGGVQLVATFIPVIGCLFLFLSFLEDSGYMARAAFIVDRALKRIGLPGKAFVPLIVGFGCNVPAVMATRTLERENDRILTTIMAPFMSCGARLTVYALFAAAFFPVGGQNIVFGLYLIGIAVAVLSALAVRTFILPRGESPFALELPPFHLPTLRGLLLQTWHKLRAFVLRAGKAIVLVVVVLNFVSSMGTDGSFGNQDSEKSVLSAIGKQIVPAFAPMGMGEDNWPAAVGIFTGIFAKEVVVGTLDALYGQIARDESPAREPESWDPLGTLGEAFATIPENLSGLGSAVLDPLGFDIVRSTDLESAAAAQEVSVDTLTIMRGLFLSPFAAFCYLLFILLYFPCVATVGAIYRELGGYWAVFSCAWSLVAGYALAVIVFQLGRLGTAPLAAAGWCGAMLALMAATLYLLVRYARREQARSRLIPIMEVS